eukprot:CAMPEP_0184676584 /NCGR_PEP_ID=MMETSP0308-20130426/88426_1 /TAXON_ID=38269 /ORGANISM="Gloeochaete witrockiana, Strain SAG 46.84" /LENGTH=99 /DNA_ID=CAMNT_0027124425 /DNA_START=1699 /DNA_END=1996 /DNA_ORIENTATION=+
MEEGPGDDTWRALNESSENQSSAPAPLKPNCSLPVLGGALRCRANEGEAECGVLEWSLGMVTADAIRSRADISLELELESRSSHHERVTSEELVTSIKW